MSRLTSLVLVILVSTVQAEPGDAPPAAPPNRGAGISGQASSAAAPVQMHVLRLRHADAGATARMFPRAGSALPGLRFIAPGPSNTVLIVGSPEAIKQTAEAIRQLDQLAAEQEPAQTAPPQELVVRNIRLANATAGEVAGTLWELFPSSKPPVTRSEALRIAVRDATNELWIRGEPQRVEQAFEAARQLDASFVEARKTAEAFGVVMGVHRLQHAEAEPLATEINQVIKTMGLRWQVVADARSNRLIVVGPPEVRQTVRLLVEALDVPAPGGPQPDAKPQAK